MTMIMVMMMMMKMLVTVPPQLHSAFEGEESVLECALRAFAVLAAESQT
jgi:DNA-binding transcriptional regulator of glucitol operon